MNLFIRSSFEIQTEEAVVHRKSLFRGSVFRLCLHTVRIQIWNIIYIKMVSNWLPNTWDYECRPKSSQKVRILSGKLCKKGICSFSLDKKLSACIVTSR